MKKVICLLLAVIIFCSACFSLGFADDEQYTWEDMEVRLKELNKYCEENWVYFADEDNAASFIELFDDLSDISARKYDFAVMRAQRFRFDEQNCIEWENRDCPYYVLLESHENEWTVYAVVYVQGTVFTKAGYYNGGSYIDKNKYDVYWSD